LRSDDDLTGIDRQEPKLLHVDGRVVTDETAECAARLCPGDDAGRLCLRLERRTAAERGRPRLEQMAA
jgi:hypothetical protein